MKWIILSLFLLLVTGLVIWVAVERSLLPKKTTLEMSKLSNIHPMKKLEGYFYMTRPDLYLKPATWSWWNRVFGQNETGETYHGKVMTKEDTGKLISLSRPLDIPDLEQIIPFAAAKSLILQDPMPSIAVMDCPCRAQKKDACLPRDVCIVIGEPFVSFTLEHHPKKARRISVDEALAIVAAEEERGHIHTAWFKDCMHNRFYTICNCCSCCCLGMASYFRGVPRVIHSGYRPVIESELCTGCGVCVDICPFKALTLDGDNARVGPELCMGCGVCNTHCPVGAVRMELAPEKGLPMDVAALASR